MIIVSRSMFHVTGKQLTSNQQQETSNAILNIK
jgi:hypothetical protein